MVTTLELTEFLRKYNIYLKDFKVDYICPRIEFEDKKEVVKEFEIKFSRIVNYDEEML